MKLFWENNKIMFISLIFLVLFAGMMLIKYKIDFNNSLTEYNKVIEYLEQNPGVSPIIPKKPLVYDAYTLFSYIVVDSPFGIIMYVLPFILMLCGSYNFYSKIKTGFFSDECMRRGYLKNLFINVLSAWKCVLVVPTFIIILFILCYLVSGNFDINQTIEYYGYSLINRKYLNMLGSFFITYTINLVLLGLFYINISLIMTKKNGNLFVTLVQSYLIFIIIGVFTEVVVGRGLEKMFPILKSYNLCNSLSIFNFWVYDNVMNLGFMTLFAFILFCVSSLIVYLRYKNKESVMLEINK